MQSKIVKIQTPRKFLLNGILLGDPNAENITIFIHGLDGDLFSQIELIEKIISKKNSVLVFNNRGSAVVSSVSQISAKERKGYKSHTIGMAHEVFTDCVDDIEGAIKCAKGFGAKKIFLMGHSTGCQKSVYYLSKKQGDIIKGVMLLAPMSDFADTFAFTDRKTYNMAVSFARKMVENGKGHDLMPERIWPNTIDAQRFISLFTPDSVEEIFSYASNRDPKLLKKIKQPVLVVLAENDEYKDRDISLIADWFSDNMKKDNTEISIIKKAPHKFQDHVDELSKVVKNWLKNI